MTTVVEPSLQIGDWLSSGVDAFGVQWRNDTFTGLFDTAPVRQAFPDRAGADGGIPQRGFESSKVVTVTGTAVAPDQMSAELAKARFRAASVNRDPMTGEDLGVDVTVHKVDGDFVFHGKRSDVWPTVPLDGPAAFKWQLVLTLDDPRLYSATLHSASASLIDQSGGTGQKSYPYSYPYDFGGSGVGSGQMVLLNDGTEITYQATTITGPGTNLRLDDSASGNYLLVSSLGAGEFVTLDHRLHRVLFMGYAPKRQLLGPGSEWFGIPPGGSVVVFGASTYTSASVSMTWRAAY